MDSLKYLAWLLPAVIGFAGNWFYNFTSEHPDDPERKQVTLPGKIGLVLSAVCLGYASWTTWSDQHSAVERAARAEADREEAQRALDESNVKLDRMLSML